MNSRAAAAALGVPRYYLDRRLLQLSNARFTGMRVQACAGGNETRTAYLRYFLKGPIKKDYVVLPESMLKEIDAFACLARTAIPAASIISPLRRQKIDGTVG